MFEEADAIIATYRRYHVEPPTWTWLMRFARMGITWWDVERGFAEVWPEGH